jgi:hypothetical protein
VETSFWGTDPSRERIATATGVAFVALAVVAFFIPGRPPTTDESSEEILAWFADKDTALLWQGFLFGLSGVFFLWFTGTVASLLRRAEADPTSRLPAIALIGAAASAALFLAAVASIVALARASDGEDATRALFDLGNAFFTMSNFTAAVFVGAVTLSIGRTAAMAEWVAWAGVVVFAALVLNGLATTFADGGFFDPGGAFPTITFLAFLAWTLILSGLLTQRSVRAVTVGP